MTAALIMASGSLAAGGCGPAGYINQVTIKADSAVAAAEIVNAEKYAPYWYTLAVQYLHRARQEAALADYQAANRFGKKAHGAAVKARALAVERAARPDDQDWLPPPSLRHGATPADVTPDTPDVTPADVTPDTPDKPDVTPDTPDTTPADVTPDVTRDTPDTPPDTQAGDDE